jgi:putative hydrolase of the HAD superfamily
MFRAILFDLGDTLLDFQPLDHDAVIRQGAKDSYERLQQLGARLPSLDKYRRGHLAAVKWAIVWSHIRRREFNVYTLMRNRTLKYGVPNDEKLMFELGWLWYRPVVAYSSIEPDLISTLQMIRNAGIQIGVVSNTFIGAQFLDRHIELMGLSDYLPMRVYSSDTRYRKPHPEIFRIALDQIGCRAQDTLFVGDVVKNDIIGSKRLGMTAALKQPLSISRNHHIADYVINRISDLIPIVLPASQVAATRA